MIILAGDIGGTKTILQLSRVTEAGMDVLYEKRYASADYGDFLSLVSNFVEESDKLTGTRACKACFGVAGPVNGRKAKITNLPWNIDADVLESLLGIDKVRLINDFQSVGYGVEVLKHDDIVTLQQGVEVLHGTRVIIGAGTGLGHGFLVWQEDHYEVVASEGGHSNLAPADDLQFDLLKYLQKRYRWATWERAVSGQGLVDIFEFLVKRNDAQLSVPLIEALKESDHAAVISSFGMAKSDLTAVKALELFVALYGAQTGNLALIGLATGGVYVAGGIAPKIIDKLMDGSFLHAFNDKDQRMQALLKAMPVKVIMNQNVGLLGSAVAASRI
ncbi:MAG: glucokinase [Methylotenera sp.]|nr:glucokinase [Methylotenera sp.]